MIELIERISANDLALMTRLTARQRELERATHELNVLVLEHLAATYSMKPGDHIEDDGVIVRASPEQAS